MSTAHATDEGKPPSGRALFLARHRRELKVLAQVGSGLCVIRGGLALLRWNVGDDRVLFFPLLIGFLALQYCAGKAADPLVSRDRVWLHPRVWIRGAFSAAFLTCALALGAVSILHVLTGRPSGAVYHVAVVTSSSGLLALLYASLALFFAYGELRKDPAEEEAQRDPDP